MPRPLSTLNRCSSLVLPLWLGSQLFQKHNHVHTLLAEEQESTGSQLLSVSFNHWLVLKTLSFFHVCYKLESFCILSDRLMSVCGCLVWCVRAQHAYAMKAVRATLHRWQSEDSAEKWVLRSFLGLSGFCMVNTLPAKPFLWPQTDDSYPVFTFRILCYAFQLCIL